MPRGAELCGQERAGREVSKEGARPFPLYPNVIITVHLDRTPDQPLKWLPRGCVW